MVMFRSISFLKRIVWTPEMALTTVDFPCATWPIVPIFIVACLSSQQGKRVSLGDDFWGSRCQRGRINFNSFDWRFLQDFMLTVSHGCWCCCVLRLAQNRCACS